MAEPQPTHPQLEEWRDIPGYEGYYQVSDHGRVRSVDRVLIRSNGRPLSRKGSIRKSRIMRNGYRYVVLSADGKQETFPIHRLVLTVFVGPCPDGMEACHWDDDRLNNRLDNLRWDSLSENRHDSVRNGSHFNSRKTHCPRGHELDGLNLMPSSLRQGRRVCLACSRARAYVSRYFHLREKLQEVSDSYYEEIIKQAA